MPRMFKLKGDYSSCNTESSNLVASKGFIPLRSLSTTNSSTMAGTTTTVTATAMTTTVTFPKVANTERSDECGHNSVVSGTGAVATCFFLIGLLMYLVAFASHDWLGLEQGTTISLWRKCHRDFVIDVWSCQPWADSPDFVRAAQVFGVIGLLSYSLSVIIIIAYLTVQFLQKIRGVVIFLCLLIFTSGCMTLLALVVMGVKGHDHLNDLKMDDREVLRLLATGVDILGQFYVGWSFVVALISALVTLSSFMCCMVEVVHVSEASE